MTAVETIGDALSAGWRVRARCVGGLVDYKTSTRKCDIFEELSLRDLAWTRGLSCSLSNLESRLKCPRCGNRRISLVFEPPAPPQANAVRTPVFGR
ncbi:hypothetical protein GCM10008171_01730 [Methylopila jiangsuensis]|uniref:Uncharacterized protein n=1 Tax=Methylopila jiangsuensis TaxID=586230 RepID=A0A9W6N259_9HYPH|nr:hypothetical protein GCM10008171_01730 [Methylopila jiangsuensis]